MSIEIDKNLQEPLESLVRACTAGDAGAWRRLVDRHAPLVYAIARSHGLPSDACDDVAQMVFFSLSRRIGSIEKPESLGAWLTTTAKRECLRQLRWKRSLALNAQEPATVPSDERFDQVEQHAILREALERLGGRCLELLKTLYFAPTLPKYEEVADTLGIPIGSIGPTRQRCLARLATLLHAVGLDRREQ